LNQCVEYIDGNHDFAQKFITTNIPLIKINRKAQGTYLLWLDLTEVANRIDANSLAAQASTGRTGNPMTPEDATVRWLARTAKVALNAGHTYGLGGANRARMNIATSRKTLAAALMSIARTLDGLKRSTSAL